MQCVSFDNEPSMGFKEAKDTAAYWVLIDKAVPVKETLVFGNFGCWSHWF